LRVLASVFTSKTEILNPFHIGNDLIFEKAGLQNTPLLSASCFLLSFLFYPEDEGDIFLRNFDRLSPEYMALCSRRQNSPEETLMQI
jgi:hypothetical protein